MARFKSTIDGLVPFTQEEEEEFDSMMAAEVARNNELTRTQYQRDRAAEYPDFRDYLDGIVKGDQVQVQAYINACLAVKAKYPKP